MKSPRRLTSIGKIVRPRPPVRWHHARCGCAIRSRAAPCNAGANLADVNGQCFLDLNNTFAILMHRDGFAPALDAVARIRS